MRTSLDRKPATNFIRPTFITQSDRMLNTLHKAELAARSDATVLITGESGAGKELIAKAIHANSRRRSGPLVVAEIAAVPTGLIESELFGHRAGAFTGSTRSRSGCFEMAHGGTLFLDEIGDLGPESQAALLRVLEDKMVVPLGTNEARKVDVRVISATHQCLESMLDDRRFREDLYYRLNVITIWVPPLRDRPEDIEILVDHFLDELSSVRGVERPVPDADTWDFLRSYWWPGNVRQLRNCVESMVVLAKSSVLTLKDLPPGIETESPNYAGGVHIPPDLTLEELFWSVIGERLDVCRGNRTRAARSLGISVRTLQRWLNRCPLEDDQLCCAMSERR
jgi:transcriptional regulator with PAS, ATPase and Fis domain